MNFTEMDNSSKLDGFLSEVIGKTTNIVEEGIVGVYVHGSLAMGGFNPGRSDIDLLIITEQRLALKTQRQLAKLFLAHSKKPFPIEISFLNRSQLRNWEHPTPYDFHFSEYWRERYEEELEKGTSIYFNDELKLDSDLAAHLTIVNTRGICLSGSPIHETFPEIPTNDYVSSILVDYEECLANIQDQPVYSVLNLIRVYGYLKEGVIMSKKEAGVWGTTSLPMEFHPVVQQAAEAYGNNSLDRVFAEYDLKRLRNHLKKKVEELLVQVE
ncbi:streptomycin 3'-adenylyltransferase [Planomicrobium koreense]|uniref:Spectinomycin 9-adenylyltransferase n=1 Tax=Planococcus koreensis TaxID=112331 RepID=A0A7W8CV32_9BACL|nr:aminoglycoside adenylyltransferase domain-containing protein [Planococcus koreensis]MBB5180949.1 streptomycin 3'-adenylyltransferase [Planococcus koreensis]